MSESNPLEPIAEIQYLENDRELAIYNASIAGEEAAIHEGNYSMIPVTMHDGRTLAEPTDLDREGFILCNQASGVADYYDEDQVTGTLYGEIIDLIRDKTGATRVEIFDHTRRAATDAVRREKVVREPASIIHNDYTANSGQRRLKDFIEQHPEMGSELGNRPFAIINAWRSIAGRVENFPLAMCDATSVAPGDLVPVTRQAKDRIGEIQLAIHNDHHRWIWYPHMEEDEVILFKTFDSRDDGRTRFTIHTAFDDPNAAQDARVRESIEIRCFVFWD